MNEVNQTIQALIASDIHKVDTAVEQNQLETATQFIELQNLCRMHWSVMLDNFASIHGGDDGKTLVLAALEGLPVAAYISALEKLAASLEQSQIDKRYVIEALRPRGRMQAFLPDNYQHPRVQALLNDLKTLLANESEAVESINDILSGETKAGLDTFREAHEDTSEGNIPKVLLQP